MSFDFPFVRLFGVRSFCHYPYYTQGLWYYESISYKTNICNNIWPRNTSNV